MLRRAHRMRLAVALGAGNGHGVPMWVALLFQAAVLFKAHSAFSNIEVREANGRRELVFDDITQSAATPGAPKELLLDYTQVSMLGLCFAEPKRVLVIGLGGGSMPSFLLAHYPDAVIDNVEIDPAVVDVATKFFDFKPGPRMRVFVQDGAEYVAKTKERYDLLFLDAYAPDFIPPALATREFFARAKAVLVPHGVIVSNVWGPPSPGYDKMIKEQRAVFDELYIVKARRSGNHIFIASEKRGVSKADLAVCAEKLSRRFGYELQSTVLTGYSRQ